MLYRSVLAKGWQVLRQQRQIAESMCVVTMTGIVLNLASTPVASAVSPSQIIVDGSARFEILSPRLIRLEYAGDKQFADGATFNMIGRDQLSATPFSTYVKDSVRVIEIDNVIMKYLEGSGPFGASNVQIELKDGSTPVVSNPDWQSSSPVFQFGQLAEAEDAALANGASVATNRDGYTGAGFGAGFWSVGAEISFARDNVPSAGQYSPQVRYSNAEGGDGKYETRTMSVIVDGQAAQTMQFPVTADWNT
jgi:hypothetical protein